MNTPKVLIVNDNPASLVAYKSVLETSAIENGYEILTANSGEDALRQFLRHEFAVALLDVNMPTMNGFETADAIHSMPRFASVPIIFLTAHAPDEMNRIRGYQKGAVDYMCTPVIPQILQTKILVFVSLAKQRMIIQNENADLTRKNAEMAIQRVRELEELTAALQSEIIERKQAESRLREISVKDPLTELLNRRPLVEHIEHAIEFCARNRQQFALLFFDLDKFKSVNDSRGHDAGDHVLIEFAARLKKAVRKADIVARLGGDEFVVLLKGIAGAAEAKIVATKIQQSIDLPYDLGSESVRISTSMGMAMYPEDGSTVKELMKFSDRAMYHEKESRTSRLPILDGDVQDDLVRHS